MEATALACQLLESVPANQLLQLRVLSACDGEAEIGVEASPRLANVIGSLHSSGLIALADAAGLAALISAASEAREVAGVLPLGSDADMTFFAPARGRLVARCSLDESGLMIARRLFAGATDRVSLMTEAQIEDEDGSVVCTGRFRWTVRRLAAEAISQAS